MKIYGFVAGSKAFYEKRRGTLAGLADMSFRTYCDLYKAVGIQLGMGKMGKLSDMMK